MIPNEKLDNAVADLEAESDLAGYAAEAAAKVLVQNWKAALRSGATIASLVPDVDDVVVALQRFKAQIEG